MNTKTKSPGLDPARKLLKALVDQSDNRWDLANLSREIGRNHAYLQQYIRRGIPAALPEDAREKLAAIFGIPEKSFKTGVIPQGTKPRIGPESDNGRPPGGLDEVAEMDVRASAGAGAVVEYDKKRAGWGFPRNWVRAELNASSSDIRIVTIEGDSMPGVLEPGDKALVNVSDRTPSPPGTFLLYDGLGLVAKRIQYIDGSDPPTIRIMSTNEAYEPYERTLEEAHIMGRIVGKWQRL